MTDITGALAKIEEAFEAIVYNYPNIDLNHVDFRVKACKISEEALSICKAIRESVPPKPTYKGSQYDAKLELQKYKNSCVNVLLQITEEVK